MWDETSLDKLYQSGADFVCSAQPVEKASFKLAFSTG